MSEIESATPSTSSSSEVSGSGICCVVPCCGCDRVESPPPLPPPPPQQQVVTKSILKQRDAETPPKATTAKKKVRFSDFSGYVSYLRESDQKRRCFCVHLGAIATGLFFATMVVASIAFLLGYFLDLHKSVLIISGILLLFACVMLGLFQHELCKCISRKRAVKKDRRRSSIRRRGSDETRLVEPSTSEIHHQSTSQTTPVTGAPHPHTEDVQIAMADIHHEDEGSISGSEETAV